jgi:hypothetical protein
MYMHIYIYTFTYNTHVHIHVHIHPHTRVFTAYNLGKIITTQIIIYTYIQATVYVHEYTWVCVRLYVCMHVM